MAHDELALHARDVRKAYGGAHALRGVDFEIRGGEVHTLAGANGSGKSTLIKILNGVEQPDGGRIEIDGALAPRLSVVTAIAHGIQVIYQDLSLFGNLTVAENIAMTARVASRSRVVTATAARELAATAVARLGLEIDLDGRVEDLPVAQRQLIAICRALAHDVRVLFMDEPTTALTWREVDTLFGVVEALRAEGVAIVFVSHKIEEVLRISDRITVLRNGAVVASGLAAEFDRDSLVEALVGEATAEDRQVSDLPADPRPVLEVRNLHAAGLFVDVDLDVRAGEIVGLTGLLGSGRSEIADAIFGIIPTTAGTVRVDGTVVRQGSPTSSIAAGIGYVPSDRLTQGVFLEQSIARNIISSCIRRTTGAFGHIRAALTGPLVDDMVRDLGIKINRTADPVRSLSGGNAQKVVIAKWLATEPKVLILNGPTVGVDIGSKMAILEILRRRAAVGMAVLLISDDVPELVSACHRVLVVRRGRLVDEIRGDAVSLESVREGIVA